MIIKRSFRHCLPCGYRLFREEAADPGKCISELQQAGAMDEQDVDTSVTAAGHSEKAGRPERDYSMRASHTLSSHILTFFHCANTGRTEMVFRLSSPSCFDFYCPTLAFSLLCHSGFWPQSLGNRHEAERLTGAAVPSATY